MNFNHLTHIRVKTLATSFVLALALCVAFGAKAQTKTPMSASRADTVLLSESIDGNYLVRRYRVVRTDDSDYSIRYLINLSKLNSSLNGNSKELSELNAFMDEVMRDTVMRVNSVTITGYSSPDGPHAFNERLAKARAQDFKNYVDRKYGFSRKFNVHTDAVAEDWEMTRMLVEQSSIPDKAAVLRVIDGTSDLQAKEMRLKEMPAAWEYMKKHILPPLRRVELVMNYGEGTVVEQRIMIERPKPAPEPESCPQIQRQCPPCDEIIIDEQINGIIVEMPNDVG